MLDAVRVQRGLAILLAASLALAGPGCSAIETYPEAAAVEICGNGIDDDLDGRRDCADEDCVGWCPEEDLAHCSNGVDDDGDGLTDWADVRCWNLGTVTLGARCPVVPGSSYDVPPTRGGWAVYGEAGADEAAVTDGPDPVDPTQAAVGLRDVRSTAVELRSAVPLVGAWIGTELRTRVYSELGVADAGDPSHGVYVTIPVGSLTVNLTIVDGISELAILYSPTMGADVVHAAGSPPSWWTVTVRVEDAGDGRLDLVATAIRQLDGMRLTARADALVGFPLTGSLDLQMRLWVYGGTGTVLVGQTHASRTGGRACDDDLVLFAADEPAPLTNILFAGGALAPDGRALVLGHADTTPYVWRSDGTSIDRVPGDAPPPSLPAPVWDETRRRFRGLRSLYELPPTLALLESEDGVTWREIGAALPPSALEGVAAEFTGRAGYAIRPERPTEARTHEIWWSASRDGVRSIVLAESPTGDPETFAIARRIEVEALVRWDAPQPTGAEARAALVTMSTIGADRVVLVGGLEAVGGGFDRVVRGYVEGPEGVLTGLDDLVLGPLDEGGARPDEGPSTALLVALPGSAGAFHGLVASEHTASRTGYLSHLDSRGP